AEAIERLVDIDAYDYRNQERLEALRGKVDDGFVQRVASRLAKSATAVAPPTTQPQAAPSQTTESPLAVTEEGRKLQALDDLIVQTEIFLQYSLLSKAVERLQKIAAMFPGEEERNARLQNLYQTANWWPKNQAKSESSNRPTVPAAAPVEETKHQGPTGRTGTYTAETLRDLTKISEINQKIFRQQTPRAMLNTT